MSILSGGMRGMMDLLDKLSVPQIEEGMKAGRYPAYLAIPAIELKTRMRKQFEQQNLLRQPSPKDMPPVAEQVMQEARNMGSSMGAEIGAGVSGLPTNLPQEYAQGGIVAFEDGGMVQRFNNQGRVDAYDPEFNAADRAFRGVFGTPFSEEELENKRIREERRRILEEYKRAHPPELTPAEVEQQKYYGTPDRSLVNALGAFVPGAGSAAMPSGMASEIGVPGFAGYEPPAAATPAQPPAAAAPAQPPVPGAAPAAAPAGIATFGGIPDIAGIMKGLPKGPVRKSIEDIQRERMYGTETQPGFVARAEGIEREREAARAAAEGKVTGKAYEELETSLRKEAEDMGADKDRAKYMAIFKAGLAMMAGTSRHALQNIGAGAMVGAEDYQKAAADIKKAQKENQRMLANIAQARRAESLGDRDRAIAEADKAAARKLKIEEYVDSAITAGGLADRQEDIADFKNRLGLGVEVAKTRMSTSAQLQAALGRGAAGRDNLTAYQAQRLLSDARREYPIEKARQELATAQKLKKVPLPGADTKFDDDVQALYTRKIYELAGIPIPNQVGAGGGQQRTFPGFETVAIRPQ